jgi:hypothetical protein
LACLFAFPDKINFVLLIIVLSYFLNFCLAFNEGIIEDKGFKFNTIITERAGNAKGGFLLGLISYLLI